MQMRRREFLTTTIAAAGTPALAASTTPSVVFEASLPVGHAFAGAARRAGASVYAIEGDITDLWFHALQPRWARSPAPLAGLTLYPALFCLERLAWDHGMRLVAFASHSQRDRVEAAALVAALFDARDRLPTRASSPPPNSTDLVSWLIAPRK